MKLEFFFYSLSIHTYENPSSGSRDIPCGQTDEHDEANSCSPLFCERA